jgi:hypothetical protein
MHSDRYQRDPAILSCPQLPLTWQLLLQDTYSLYITRSSSNTR